MENQLAQTEILIRRIAIIAVLLVLVIGAIVVGFQIVRVSDPYFQSILSLNGDSARGHAIFQINCAGCHGIEAAGRVGPSLQHVSQRKSKIGLIQQVTSGETPPMPKFQPHPQEMADLLSYLEQL
ncbi:MAG TPA: cytochrome C [Cyanobacteria bacterium UBA11149]|nr:cytochrome C [Cyanobacteria bacterium UBA11367]HBE57102.1 cytochrome C [Cyanobacteria bacterium UBA11366]HBK62113.1 cytochrome C [Cyanobacteria bacterium UBA11166]HBR76633.1 cytochrome C [Cyanobacteria bacterium UBA11159]HBS68351.1 cytochrome C [Cyanobacteria bacterium UBA11153]HBW92419.1 cytochrome C [Cyanobacteria bacterium UBA11149]